MLIRATKDKYFPLFVGELLEILAIKPNTTLVFTKKTICKMNALISFIFAYNCTHVNIFLLRKQILNQIKFNTLISFINLIIFKNNLKLINIKILWTKIGQK